MNRWHTQSIEDTVSALKTRAETGLGRDEAVARRETYGPNELEERAGKSPLRMLWEQFTETMVLILIAAAIVSGFLGKGTETVAILGIVVLFAVLGFVQEYRAERPGLYRHPDRAGAVPSPRLSDNLTGVHSVRCTQCDTHKLYSR